MQEHLIVERAQRLIIHQLSGLSGKALLNVLAELHLQTSAQACVNILKRYESRPRAILAYESLAQQEASSRMCSIGDIATLGERDPDLKHIAKQLTWMDQNDVSLIAWPDDNYPPLLKEIPQPPAFLYLQGNADLLHQSQIAMVGARKATPVGLKTAYQLASDLARSGLVISSGMARGIDAQCHLAALDQGLPTIAILGTGIDVVYPKGHTQLASQIAKQGLLVSEFSLGSAPVAYHFPQRNRILSGLSLGVVVVEANEKSGSLITAKFALEQGREVFAVPGSVHNPMTSGCHALIKEGACLVQSAQDVTELLVDIGLFKLQCQQQSMVCSESEMTESIENHVVSCDENRSGSDNNHLVLSFIEDQGTPLDDLYEQSGLELDQLHQVLLELECAEKVISRMGLYYKN